MLEERKKGGASEVWRAQSVDALHPLPGQRNIKKARSHSYIASGAKVSSKYQHVESKVKKYIEEMKRTEPTKQKQDEYGQRGLSSAVERKPRKYALDGYSLEEVKQMYDQLHTDYQELLMKHAAAKECLDDLKLRFTFMQSSDYETSSTVTHSEAASVQRGIHFSHRFGCFLPLGTSRFMMDASLSEADLLQNRLDATSSKFKMGASSSSLNSILVSHEKVQQWQMHLQRLLEQSFCATSTPKKTWEGDSGLMCSDGESIHRLEKSCSQESLHPLVGDVDKVSSSSCLLEKGNSDGQQQCFGVHSSQKRTIEDVCDIVKPEVGKPLCSVHTDLIKSIHCKTQGQNVPNGSFPRTPSEKGNSNNAPTASAMVTDSQSSLSHADAFCTHNVLNGIPCAFASPGKETQCICTFMQETDHKRKQEPRTAKEAPDSTDNGVEHISSCDGEICSRFFLPIESLKKSRRGKRKWHTKQGNMHNRVLEELRASCELGSAIRRHSVDLLESLRC